VHSCEDLARFADKDTTALYIHVVLCSVQGVELDHCRVVVIGERVPLPEAAQVKNEFKMFLVRLGARTLMVGSRSTPPAHAMATADTTATNKTTPATTYNKRRVPTT
jgi:hypothetical protein